MGYKVIKHFLDMQDNNYAYKEGDEYPREGMSVLPSRLRELASKKNRQGVPLLEEIEEEKPEKKTRSAKSDNE